MANVAFVFPGQGIQYVGMGKKLYENYQVGRSYFDLAEKILKIDIKKICFTGPGEILNTPLYAQLAILITSYINFIIFKQEQGKLKPVFVSGHSLGLYTAFIVAGAMDYESCLSLVKCRAESMQAASQIYKGKMFAVIGTDLKNIEEICQNIEGCFIANINSPQQIVVSVGKDYIEDFLKVAEKAAKKIIQLNTQGAFHCKYMNYAKEKLSSFLKNNNSFIKEPNIDIISNRKAEVINKREEIIDEIINQVVEPVKWWESVNYIINRGVKRFIEIGPGKGVLCKLIKRINEEVEVTNIDYEEEI